MAIRLSRVKTKKTQCKCSGGPYDGDYISVSGDMGTLPFSVTAKNKSWRGRYVGFKRRVNANTLHPIVDWEDL